MRKKELVSKVGRLEYQNMILNDEVNKLRNKIEKIKKAKEMEDRNKILEKYDIAVLVKNGKTYLLQKGKNEERLVYYSISQEVGAPIKIKIDKILL